MNLKHTTKYHGCPFYPAHHIGRFHGHNFCVSYQYRGQEKRLLGEGIARSVMLDSGAFTCWKRGGVVDWNGYYAWSEKILSQHENTWAIIGDVIDGTEADNDALIDQWPHGIRGAPVWHLHESLDRLKRLCLTWPLVCFGSSGEYATVGTQDWHTRMSEAFDAIVLPDGTMPTRLHMLRGLMCIKRFKYPFDSADSTTVAFNFWRDAVMRDPLDMIVEWDAHHCPKHWRIG